MSCAVHREHPAQPFQPVRHPPRVLHVPAVLLAMPLAAGLDQQPVAHRPEHTGKGQVPEERLPGRRKIIRRRQPLDRVPIDEIHPLGSPVHLCPVVEKAHQHLQQDQTGQDPERPGRPLRLPPRRPPASKGVGLYPVQRTSAHFASRSAPNSHPVPIRTHELQYSVPPAPHGAKAARNSSRPARGRIQAPMPSAPQRGEARTFHSDRDRPLPDFPLIALGHWPTLAPHSRRRTPEPSTGNLSLGGSCQDSQLPVSSPRGGARLRRADCGSG
jgi:hypothetical protein